jgi:hypothetical protein
MNKAWTNLIWKKKLNKSNLLKLFPVLGIIKGKSVDTYKNNKSHKNLSEMF